MKIAFRLAEILNEHGQQRGIIMQIANHTKLERHQVAALLRNEAKHISLEQLASLCDYLVEHHQVDAAQLPGMLFGREPDEFWAMLAERRHLELCLGLRWDKKLAERMWVMASDSHLQGTLLHGISGAAVARDHSRVRGTRRHSFTLEQRLVRSPDREVDPDVRILRHDAETVYSDFHSRTGDRALVCLGSMKSNPVVEMVLANAFHAQPFRPLDDIHSHQQWRVPFMFRYRQEDPKPPSCYGCFTLSSPRLPSDPGIYYENPKGEWTGCTWDKETSDAAMVFYAYRPPLGTLEMVLGGFSGRGTRCLARLLHEESAKFWPPCYSVGKLYVGAYVVKFGFKPSNSKGSNLDAPWPTSTEVIALSEKVLKRRLKP